MKRSETWISGIIRQNSLKNLGTVPVVVMSGQDKRSVTPQKSKSELGSFKVGVSIIGEGEVI